MFFIMTKKARGSLAFVSGAITGAAIGAVIGVLFAPKSGKQTRAALKRKGKSAVRQVRNYAEEAGDMIEPKVQKVSKGVKGKISELKSGFKEGFSTASTKKQVK